MIIKKIIRYLKRYSFHNQEIKRLLNIPRYVESSTNILFNIPLALIDGKSFVWQYEDIFEAEIYKFEADKDTPFIIDCGANIGLSILYFKKLYPKCKIIAFEADPCIFRICKSNINSFKLNNVDLFNYAVWNTEGKISFNSEGGDGGSVTNENPMFKKIEVDSVLLSNYLSNPVDLLKIDIEGAETSVLMEIEQNLHNVKRIFIEYHSQVGKKQDLDIILNILKNNGFRCYLKTTGLINKTPFIKIDSYNGFDNFINIFGCK